jgi:hypothetical protein
LALIGGVNQDKLLTNILNFSLTIKLARKFCWTGREEKGDRIGLCRFKDTELCSIIKGAVRKGFEKKNLTDDYFKSRVSSFLDASKDVRKKIVHQNKTMSL